MACPALKHGNLVLQDGSDVKMLWQSFQHPSESLLQQMKLSSDQSTGEKVVLKSWRSPSDPSVGNFSAGVDLQTVPQLTVWNGNYKYWRSGPWDNQVFTGVESMTSTYQSRVIVDDDNEGSVTMSFTFVEGMTSFFRLNPDGSLVQIYWAEEKQDWEVTWSSLETECGVYGKCGPFGSCNSRTPQICTCLPGFEPAHEDAWKRGNFSGGCVRRLLLQCEGMELKLTTMKLPDFQELSDVPENKCESQCVNYCSCAAYTYLNGIGCMIWKGNLIDLQKFDNGGADLYIRLASSELDNERKKRTVIAISVSIGSIIMTMCAYFTWMRLVNHRGMEKLRKVPLFRNYSEFQENSTEVIQEITARDVKLKELPLCKFEELALATGNFNLTNKLGQGGFGPLNSPTSKLHGYMAPEYAMQGRFSEKSDVFSFGVLLIEIVSGKRNTGFYNNEQALSLLGLAWRLWNEDKIVTFIDQRISYQGFESQILRCLHVGLLCVQDFAADRPTTSKVLSMLSSETSALPSPNQPAFTERHASSRTSSSEPSHQRCSVNDVTVTVLRGR
ncbi:unnamed protein product [Thlaspi arvense]|uniref:Apple domain-containing protein n=1 Tax=Thlaspi arvense TaxID=13288 RepID=A0AAU9RKV0_THLAR|nr:unnamed protein product [Thlaspi arvense]